MRVYLDNCCFNRPFDDQRQMRVRLEAEAKLCIQEHIRSGTLELVWSYMLDFENAAHPFEERRTTISGWRQYATMNIEETATILQRANLLAGIGLKAKDALHIACAIAEQGHGADALKRAAHARRSAQTAFHAKNITEFLCERSTRMNRAQIDGRALEYEVRGAGEPVVLVHGSHIADAFAPLLAESVLT